MATEVVLQAPSSALNDDSKAIMSESLFISVPIVTSTSASGSSSESTPDYRHPSPTEVTGYLDAKPSSSFGGPVDSSPETNDKRDAGHGAISGGADIALALDDASHTVWRIEFRGVSKLVRWVSKRGSKRVSQGGNVPDSEMTPESATASEDASSSDGASRELRRRHGRVRGRSRDVSRHSSSNSDRDVSRTSSTHSSQTEDVDGVTRDNNNTRGDVPPVPYLPHSFLSPARRVSSSSPSAFRSPPSAMPVLRTTTSRGHTESTKQLSLGSRISRSLSMTYSARSARSSVDVVATAASSSQLQVPTTATGAHAHEVARSRSSDDLQADVEELLTEKEKPRPRKLSKARRPNPSLSTTQPLPGSNRESVFSFASTVSFASSTTSTRSQQQPRRRLSKQSYPASAYSAPHLTNLRPAFLDSLPEVQPTEPITMSPLTTPTLERPRAVFELYDGEESGPPSRTWSTEDIFPPNGRPPPISDSQHLQLPEHPQSTDERRKTYPLTNNTNLPSSSSGPTGILKRNVSRRWSAAITDIADDLEFLRELEYELAHGGVSSIGMNDIPAWSASGSCIGHSDDGHGRYSGMGLMASPGAVVSEDGHASQAYDPYAEAVRLDNARKAIMCVREIVRTERSYLNHLVSASEREHSPNPATSVFYYHLPRLITVSKTLSAALEGDASIWGVAASFVACAPHLESAMVKWCSVVGGVMTSPEFSPPPLPPSRTGSLHSIFGGGRGEGRMKPLPPLGPNATGPSAMPVPVARSDSHSSSRTTLGSDDGYGHGPSAMHRNSSVFRPFRRSSAPPTPHRNSSGLEFTPLAVSKASEPTPSTPPPAPPSPGTGAPPVPPSKILTLQDIAIMPTQRVVRYVMLYQDLLRLTPTSSRSYAIVKEALRQATRLAKSCNEAQSNMTLS